MWKQFRSKLDFVLPKGTSPLIPSEKDLDRFEKEFKLVLPKTYRAFVREIGPGTLGGYFVISAPLYDDDRKYGLQKKAKLQQTSDVLASIYGKDVVSRLVPFGGSIIGDIFAFDPTTRRGIRNVEYSIFALPRDQERVVLLTEDFKSFILDTCFRNGLNKALGFPKTRLRVDYVFRPHSKRTKRTAEKGSKASKSKTSEPKVKATKKKS